MVLALTPFRFLTLKKESQSKVCIGSTADPGLSFQAKALSDAQGKTINGVYIVLNDWDAWTPQNLHLK